MSFQQAKPEGLVENLQAFTSAIHWTEPFILGIIAFHIIMFVITCLIARQNVGLAPRLSVMVFIAIVVRTAEYWNHFLSGHWESIASQNYFDKNGVFVAIVICVPLLLDCMLMLLMFTREAFQLLVKVKTNELKRKKKSAAAGAGKDGTTTTTTNNNNNNNNKKESKKEQ